jgi:hypothetical protein
MRFGNFDTYLYSLKFRTLNLWKLFRHQIIFDATDQVLRLVILRRLTSKLLFRTQKTADEESHVSKGSVCFFPF